MVDREDPLRVIGVLIGIGLVALGASQAYDPNYNDAVAVRGAMFFIGGAWLIAASTNII